MTKREFSKMILRALGAVCFIIGTIAFCSQTDHSTVIGGAAFLAAVGLILCSSLVGMPKDTLEVKVKRIVKTLAVVLVTVVLHGLGIVLMSNVNWIAGFVCILLGLVNLLFLIPATKGFDA